jgi:hypothetical protein
MCEPQAKAPDGDLQTVTALLVGGRRRSLAGAIEDCDNSTGQHNSGSAAQSAQDLTLRHAFGRC